MKKEFSLMKMENRFGGKSFPQNVVHSLLFITVTFLLLFVSDTFIEMWVLPKRLFGCLGGASFILLFSVFRLLNSAVTFPSLRYQTSCIVCNICILIIFSWISYLSSHEKYMSGTFDNPAGLATALVLSTPFVIRYQNNLPWKFITTTILLITMCATQSRIGMLCLMGYFLVNLKIAIRLKWTLMILAAVTTVILFLYKAQSTEGRLFIISQTLEIIGKSPWKGNGLNGFSLLYMPHQAAFFAQNPTSPYALLADNIGHPLNEYLYICTNIGLIGLMIVSFVYFILLRTVFRIPQMACYCQSLILLLILSVGTYPFHYPFTWFILSASIINALNATIRQNRYRKLILLICMSGALAVVINTITLVKTEITWNRTFENTRIMNPKNAIPLLDDFFLVKKNDEFYLYTFAESLIDAGEYKRAENVVRLRGNLLHDYYQEYLYAKLFECNGDFDKAAPHYLLASNMCPSKFYPLYKSYMMYKQLGRRDICVQLIERTKRKKIKIITANAVMLRDAVLRDSVLWEPLLDSLSVGPMSQ